MLMQQLLANFFFLFTFITEARITQDRNTTTDFEVISSPASQASRTKCHHKPSCVRQPDELNIFYDRFNLLNKESTIKSTLVPEGKTAVESKYEKAAG